jgi:hypothetical protein
MAGLHGDYEMKSGFVSKLPLGVLLVVLGLINIGLAPQQLSTTAFMTTTRQPQYGLFALSIVNVVACVVLLVRIRQTKLGITAAAAVLIALLTLFAWYSGLTA